MEKCLLFDNLSKHWKLLAEGWVNKHLLLLKTRFLATELLQEMYLQGLLTYYTYWGGVNNLTVGRITGYPARKPVLNQK